MFILFEVDQVRQVVVILIIINQQCSTSAMLVLVLLTEQTGEYEYIILLFIIQYFSRLSNIIRAVQITMTSYT